MDPFKAAKQIKKEVDFQNVIITHALGQTNTVMQFERSVRSTELSNEIHPKYKPTTHINLKIFVICTADYS